MVTAVGNLAQAWLASMLPWKIQLVLHVLGMLPALPFVWAISLGAKSWA